MNNQIERLKERVVGAGPLSVFGALLLLVSACSTSPENPSNGDDVDQDDDSSQTPGDDDSDDDTDVGGDDDTDVGGDDDTDVGGDDDTDVGGDDDTDVGGDDDTGGGDDDEPTTPMKDGGTPSTDPKMDGGTSKPDSSTPSKPDSSTPSTPDSGSEPSEPTDPGPSEPGGEASCLDSVTNYGATGPFKYAAKHQGAVKIWVPTLPAGCKVPIVHLANGTGATCSAYQRVLNSLASHGFLTTCYENTNTGAGTQGIMAFDTVLKNHADIALRRFGSTGHSQGGQSSFIVLRLAEEKYGADAVYAGLAMQPASGFGAQPSGGSWQSHYAKIKSPMFMFSGTSDVLVSQAWVRQAFTALDDGIEAYHWSARGSTHIPTPQAETAEVAIPWFRWKLLGDKKACMAFKALKGAGRWSQVSVQNEKGCE